MSAFALGRDRYETFYDKATPISRVATDNYIVASTIHSAKGENGSTFFLSVLLMKSFRSIKLKKLVGKMKSARCMSL